MPARTIQEQVQAYLTDAHGIEEQALVQMRRAPKIAGDPQFARIFERHLAETEEHERLVRERLRELGTDRSRVKDTIMAAGGLGFAMFAQSQPDTPGKLASHALSYEALEQAGYELLRRVAERAGDAETAAMASRILVQERDMKERVEGMLDRTAAAALQDKAPEDLGKQVVRYLTDAHALENQAEALLDRARSTVGDPRLAAVFGRHLGETSRHKTMVEQRLEDHGESPSKLKDVAMKLGGVNWSAFFGAQPDTPGKLVAFAYAFEHLEIGGYEQLARVAERAGDRATAQVAREILRDERATAERLAGAFDRAAELALEAQGVAE